ncbi:uncharacterized protein LOC113372423 [Ctenocephalides felis]|uniref:uncharacterized protein LOC113372423 n=1 Tax=Ctenocephalides felis TaxID=7515 RepID=UPI000E6E2CC3|nr:uncharacterized protein LOC113372423 [Ctenocephalides felis]
MSASLAARRSLGTLWRQGWNEIPEVMLSTAMGLAGVGISCYAIYRTYVLEGGDYRKYRMGYVVYRPDDPRVAKIRPEDR